MTPKWITGLVRARQYAEDSAKQELATAERLASRAHARVRYNADRLESLKYAGAEANAASFVASAVALQAAAATHAAARAAAAQADHDANDRRGNLTDAAVSRRSAEEMADRAKAAEKARQALLAQRATDEVAATVFRRNHENDAAAGNPGGDMPAEAPTVQQSDATDSSSAPRDRRRDEDVDTGEVTP